MDEIIIGPRGVPDYAKRRNDARRLLYERGLDALLVTAPSNRFYLSGFEVADPQPDESSGLLIIAADGRDLLATDSRYKLAAEKLWPASDIIIYGADKNEVLAAALAKSGALVGFDAKNLSLDAWRRLKAARGGRFSLLPADGLVESLRIVKDDWEIAALKASFALNHALMRKLEKDLPKIRESGISELELSWEIEKFFRENGADDLAFANIVAFGKNGASPHAIPGRDKAPANGPVLFDLGCRVADYCSDQTRTWWLGSEPSPEFVKTMSLVREAQSAAIAAIKPGVPCSRIYETAREVFDKAGVASAFTHGLGHGVGLQTHEAPSFSPRDSRTLRAGMVVTVEPGLYYGEWGGVRWENTILVTDDGAEIL